MDYPFEKKILTGPHSCHQAVVAIIGFPSFHITSCWTLTDLFRQLYSITLYKVDLNVGFKGGFGVSRVGVYIEKVRLISH